jgi:hypothetical protein
MLARSGSDRLVHTSDAAVVKDAYLVELRDGTRTDTVERSLGEIETRAIPLLRGLRSRWPLGRAERAVIAEYLAVQMSRTPDALRRHGRLVDAALAQSNAVEPRDSHGRDALRMRAMLFIKNRMISVISAMQWTLVSFKQPLLSTSDHPVAVVSIDLGQTSPDLGVEVDNIGELWLAVDPTTLLVCCWRDLPDSQRPRSGQRRIAESVNAAMREQAEAGWYWHPDTTPCMPADDRIHICSERLFPGYGPTKIRQSAHRQAALRELASAPATSRNATTVFHPTSSR